MSKVVFITGGSSGLGKAIGEYLHHRGFTVYGTSRNPEKIMDSTFPLLAMDVREAASIQEAIAQVHSTCGRIDVLINNAGVGITGPIEEIPLTEVKNNFETNFFGPLVVIQSVLPIMRTQQAGMIINITSIAGYMGLPFRGVYSASKGALEIVSEALSMEVKKMGIQVVNVAPGDFATNIATGRYHAPVLDESAYATTYGATLEQMNNHVSSGSNPEEMARVIHSILNDSHPRLHYKVGAFLQQFSIVLKRILPDRVYERMLMKHYKL